MKVWSEKKKKNIQQKDCSSANENAQNHSCMPFQKTHTENNASN